MTRVLCLTCGGSRWGIFGSCHECKSGGSFELGLKFSDWFFEPATLATFGKIIQEINRHCTDPRKRAQAFLYHVSRKYPSILTVHVAPERADELDEILARCTLPEFTLLESELAKLSKRRDEARPKSQSGESGEKQQEDEAGPS